MADPRSHLCALSTGLEAVPQQKRWQRDPATRLEVMLEALAFEAGAPIWPGSKATIPAALSQCSEASTNASHVAPSGSLSGIAASASTSISTSTGIGTRREA